MSGYLDGAAWRSAELGAAEVPKGRHASLIYSTREEPRGVVSRFVAAGLAQSERCLYLLNDRSLIELVDSLYEVGIDVGVASADGALRILRAQQVYIGSRGFEPRLAASLLETAAMQAITDGYSGLRAAVDMDWLGRDSASRVLDYERTLERGRSVAAAAGRRFTALCLYDARRSDPDLLNAVRAVHSVVLGPRQVERAPSLHASHLSASALGRAVVRQPSASVGRE